MGPVIIGLALAAAFGIVATAIYGHDQSYSRDWIDLVFWSLIATGALISAVNAIRPCLPCRMSRLIRFDRLAGHLCAEAPCRA